MCAYWQNQITQKDDTQSEKLDVVLLLLVHKCVFDLCRTCTINMSLYECLSKITSTATQLLNSRYTNIVQFLTLSLTAVGVSFHTYSEDLWL
jgi:hypothetical protein